MINPVGWFEIHVHDMDRAKRFYTQVLGTEFTRIEGAGFDVEAFPMSHDAQGIGGALVRMPGVEPGHNSVVVYFTCQDCAEQAARAPAAGGQLLKPKTAIGEYGHIALISDSEGNTIGLHSMA